MLRFVVRRLLFMVFTLWVVITVAFFLMRVAPGGPFDGNRRLPPEVEQNLLAAYHLDEPLVIQYVRYVGNALTGDLGPSFRQRDFSVNDLIASGFPISVVLGLSAMTLALCIGIVVGAFSALYHQEWVDRALSGMLTLGLAVPPIVVAPVLVLLFAVVLRWFPAGGSDSFAHFVLPVVALSLPYSAAFARLVRSGCIDGLSSQHVVTARSKGLDDSAIIRRHVLPAGVLPLISFLGPAAASMLAGSVVVEQVFSLPGLGRYFAQSALDRDYTMVMGTVIVYASLILGFNLLVDVVYAKMDPRVRQAAFGSHE